MYFDRFDILSAYYLFGSDYHSCQFSKEYAYIVRSLNAGFRPGPCFGHESLSENGKAIYANLVNELWDNDVWYKHTSV